MMRSLESVCELVVDCPHATPVWTDEGALVFRSANIRNGRLDLTRRSFTTEEEYAKRVARAVPSEGDVIITREAPMGEVALIPADVRGCLGQRMVLLRPKAATMDSRFLLYALMSPQVQHEIGTHEGTGSTVSNLRIPSLKALKIPCPSLSEQRAIANILGTLDDKISLNRRTNGTLEAMARALFKSWFVDFDPVRAKKEKRRLAGMDEQTASLFPAGFEESRLGPIPRGWVVAPALSVFSLLSGGTPKTAVPDYWGGDVKWASAKDVSQATGFFLLDTERKITDAGVESSAAKLIPKNAVVVVARGATCGRHAILGEEMAMNQTCYALVSRRPDEQLYLSLLATNLIDGLVRQAHGSIFDTITTATFETAHVLAPAKPVVDAFSRYVAPWLQRIQSLQRESETLTELRDAILPKLLSGELPVTEQTQLFGGAA